MGLKECQIFFDNPWNSYYPGQTVNGHVEFTFEKLKKVRGICIKFKGEGKTSWQQKEARRSSSINSNSSHSSNTHYVSYSAEEEYFNISYYLLGSSGGEAMEIPAGTHTYPFTCTLPPTLPSSFEGEYGHVRYTVKATLDRPWKFDQDTKTAFTVVSHLDLNMMPQCNAPINVGMSKRFCCFCCKSGPLRVEVNVPVSGFCSGQGVPIDIAVENGSRVRVDQIVVQLKKIVVYRARVPVPSSKYSDIEIARVTFDAVEKNSSTNYQQVMTIPPLPPSSLMHCSLIDLDYELKIECCVEGCHMNMDDKRAITIGTVPLVGFQPPPSGTENVPIDNQMGPAAPLLYDPTGPQPNPQNGTESITVPYPADPGQPLYPNVQNFSTERTPYPNNSYPENQPSFSNPYAQQPPMNPNYGPPVFHESQFKAKSIHDDNDSKHTKISGNTEFAPRYPTYGFIYQPSSHE